MKKIDFNKLTIKDDFLFVKVMEDEEICKKVIEIILNIKIEKIEYLERQKDIDIILDKKSIRLDVYVQGDDKIYNVEMQVLNNKDLIKRTRYYQGLIDLNQIEKGEHYRDLKPSYIIFICCFDPFNLGYPKYEFENMCVLKNEEILKLEDKTYKVFLNSKGFEKEDRKELKAFLNYVNNNKLSNDEFIKILDDKLDQIKQNKEWRLEYMTLEMKLDERYYSGFEKGIEEGITQGIEKERIQGRINNIINAVKNKVPFNMLNLMINDITKEEYDRYVDLVNNGDNI